MSLRKKLTSAYQTITRTTPQPAITEIPDLDTAKKYEREEYFYLAYMGGFLLLFMAWIVYTPDLIDLLLVYFPSIGPVPGFWIINIAFGLGLAVIGMFIRQAKINYVHKLSERANAYPVISGTITEMQEDGYTVKHFQLAIKDIREVAKGGHEIPLPGNPGTHTVNPNDHMYQVTTAYTPEDSILHKFPIITEHPLDDHLTLKRFEDVFFGLVGINVLVSKIHFVVPQRIQDQHPVMYVAHSAVTVEQILQRQTPKLVDETELYATERLWALTQGERLHQANMQQAARIKELERQTRKYRLELRRKAQERKKEQSTIMTPEKDHIPFFGGYLTGWKMYLIIAIIVVAVFALAFFGGSYLGFW